MSQFRFTDQQWHEYQEMPDQGYSHRGFLEDAVNAGLTEHTRQAQETAWNQGAESAFYNPEIRGLVDYPDTNPYEKETK